MQGSEGVAAEGPGAGTGRQREKGCEQEPALKRASRLRIGTLNSFCGVQGRRGWSCQMPGPVIKAEWRETRHIQALKKEAVCRVGSELIGLHTKRHT